MFGISKSWVEGVVRTVGLNGCKIEVKNESVWF